jgi:protein O-GlcNAc transferase
LNNELIANLSCLAERAFEHHGAGRTAQAESCYLDILSIDAHYGDALFGLGILEWQQGRNDVAHLHLSRALAESPHEWRYCFALGQFAAATGRHADAVSAFERATHLRPESVDAWFGLANALYLEESLSDSAAAYRQVIALQPENAEAFNNLGLTLERLGNRDESILAYRQGLALNPDCVPLYNNLGNALLVGGMVEEAIAVFRQGISLTVNSGELWFNYGNALAAREADQDALNAYRHALDLDPAHVKAMINLANTLRVRGELDAALALYMRAIAVSPQWYDAYNNLGVALLLTGRIDEAVAALEKAIELVPTLSAAHNNLANVYKSAGRMDLAIGCYRRAIELDPNDTQAYSNLVYSISFHPAYDEQSILAEVRQFALANGLPHFPASRTSRPGLPERRIRIGYVSPDFRNHCQSLFTIPLLSNHDHTQFEIYCYAHLPRPDDISQRLKTHADVWRTTQTLSDEQLAGLIESDKIDILVDLTMHMSGGRPKLFARKPAPVQLAWLAYPGTTGIPAIDYRLTDPWLDPPEFGDDRYTEQSIRLPDTFWCYDPLTTGLQPNPLPALTTGHITFGCLNNFCKVSDDTLCRWGQVMSHLPSSRLLLLAAAGKHRQRVFEILGRYGISPHRITFVEPCPRAQYLMTYHRIDICLDTLPYNGHTTSLDACWMGVPVVTQVGHTIVGRAGWSQLNNLGLPELAAFDDQGFVEIAVSLANNPDRLNLLRSTLRSRMEQSPLMDGKRFAGAIEAVYRHILHDSAVARATAV